MSRPIRVLSASCLVLFPLLFIVVAGTRLHPSLPGDPAQQIRELAAQSAQWRLAHAILAGASLVGVAAVLILWRLVTRGGSGPVAATAHVAMVAAAAGAAMLSGVVLMETGLVAPLAEACTRSQTCLSSADPSFPVEFARLGWGDVPPLGWAGIPLALGLFALGAAGWFLGPLRTWEAPVLVLSAIGVLFTNPGLHGRARYPLAFMLVAMCGLAVRLIRTGELRQP